ncbi:hypothetical protein [Sporosalibacterium faouarense]|uniref:hypothetical protein n=1 Tax=Sporosalibacterium faouarense TaxID=516123 RepID=UPI00141D0148|nr:hypothetical protein [Sporosalibacterium faouarense]MTI48617.1 hypothetical protein [Bacillota bacterium]
MTDPLIRTMMNNVANQSGKVSLKDNVTNDSSTSNMHINEREKKEILNIIKKKDYTKPNDYSYNRNRTNRKIQLEDLVGDNKKSFNQQNNDKRNKTMMSLDDLVNKSKTNSSSKTKEQKDSKHSEPYKKTKEQSYVKSNVIGNLEAYVPKVSLNSIGKKGSLR